MKNRIVAALLFALFCATAWPQPAQASQGSCVMPTTGTVSGLTLVQDINTCINALMTNNSGASAPANGTGAVALVYQLWLKTGDQGLYIYDSANWLPMGYIDSSGHVWQPKIGGGYDSTGLASATTTDLCSVAQGLIKITGVTTINSFSNTCQTGEFKALLFNGVLTLTHNATSMVLPNNGNNITTAAGDRAWAVYLGGSNWEVFNYVKADGSALNASATFTGAIFYNSIISPTALASNTNNWNPTSLSTSNTIRFSCAAGVTISGIVAPATDGQIVILHNIGATNGCTLSTQDTNSTAANRFVFPADMIVGTNRSTAIIYDLTTARWRLAVGWQKPPTVQYLTSGSGATYTTAAGATRLEIRAIGGGGSGSVDGGAGNIGGTTSFNSVNANGGSGASAANSGSGVVGGGGSGGTGGTGSASLRLVGGAGTNGSGFLSGGVGICSGGTGGNGPFGGGGNAILSGALNTGAGGGGLATSGSNATCGGGGGAGEYYELSIVSPAATYTYTVGAGGAAPGGAGAGGTGLIIVKENYNFLLRRDLAPAANDNRPMFLDAAA